MSYFPPQEDEDASEQGVGWALGLLFSLLVAAVACEVLRWLWFLARG
jgi:hypothetical protein